MPPGPMASLPRFVTAPLCSSTSLQGRIDVARQGKPHTPYSLQRECWRFKASSMAVISGILGMKMMPGEHGGAWGLR